MIQFQEDARTEGRKDGWKDVSQDGRKDGQTLFHRTFPATAGGLKYRGLFISL